MKHNQKCRHGCRCADCGRRWCSTSGRCPQCARIAALEDQVTALQREVAGIPRTYPTQWVYPSTWTTGTVTVAPCKVCGKTNCTDTHIIYAPHA